MPTPVAPTPPIFSTQLLDCIFEGVVALVASVPDLDLEPAEPALGPLLELLSHPEGVSSSDWPTIVSQFVFLCGEVADLPLSPAVRDAIRDALARALRGVAEARRPLTVDSLDAALRRLDRTPLATSSGAFDVALSHLDALQGAFIRASQIPRVVSVDPLVEASLQVRQLELLDDAVRRFDAAVEAGGPRQAPESPKALPAPDGSAPLWGWGGLLLLAVTACSVGCALLAGAAGKTR
jgi:hypothetical protein